MDLSPQALRKRTLMTRRRLWIFPILLFWPVSTFAFAYAMQKQEVFVMAAISLMTWFGITAFVFTSNVIYIVYRHDEAKLRRHLIVTLASLVIIKENIE